MTDRNPGPYEHTGVYARGDMLRQWIVTAGEWKAEALRLSKENAELRARLETYRALADGPFNAAEEADGK